MNDLTDEQREKFHKEFREIREGELKRENFPNPYPPAYPDCYLYVEECRSGESWILPLSDDDLLDLRRQIERWIEREYGNELEIDGSIMPRLQGDYYAKIMTDNRPPDSAICWTSGGFYLKTTY